MNRIYLFLAALLAFSGLNLSAADFNIEGTMFDGSTWTSKDMRWRNDDDSKNEKHYSITFKAVNDKPQWVVKTAHGSTLKSPNASNMGDWYLTFSNTVKVSSESVSGYGNNIQLDTNVELTLDNYYTIHFYYTSKDRNANNDKLTHYMTIRTATTEEKGWAVNESGSGDGGGGGSVVEDGYYFYGDMNLWSSQRNANTPVKVLLDEENRAIDHAKEQFGANIPKYYTKEKLQDWKFKKVTAGSKYATYLSGKGVSDPTNYYYLDFANLADPEGHKGRLCGQFKITMGDEGNGNNWGGTNGNDNTGYYGWSLTANSSTAYEPDKGEGKQNMQLEANAVENAVLYFKPGDKAQVYLQGTPQYYYVYYAVVGGTASSSGLNWKMVRNGQENYYLNNAGFDGTSMTTTGGNPKNSGTFTWESVTTSSALDANNGSQYWKNGKINYNGLEFTQVIRRRIPSGATHRFPVPLTVTMSDADGKYPETQVNCQDIWFINTANASGINVYFRYDDDAVTESLNWAAYNIFNYTYKNNVRSGYNYLFGGTKAFGATAPSITNGEYAVMQLVDHVGPEGVSHKWWKSAADIPMDFTTNSWVIFGESRGGVYPVDRVEADRTDLVDVQMNGQNLYYVATTKENPSLLYSHLNGTFKLSESEGKTVQINAEFFDPETIDSDSPAIVTHTGQVSYRYEIYWEGKLVESSDELPGADDEGFTEQPYYDWYLGNGIDSRLNKSVLSAYKPAYYYVIVKAKYNGKVYTAQDTYAIY